MDKFYPSEKTLAFNDRTPMALATVASRSQTWPLYDRAGVQFNQENVWAQGGDAWSRYDAHKDTKTTGNTRN